ncbi:hypothetical protein EDD15DRAFT_5138 [Pisolithus albus]|nr:hypothetical protein EDD15DRAFT_5138 [Pisolithus albus]
MQLHSPLYLPSTLAFGYAPTTVSPGTIAVDAILAHMHPTSGVARPGLSQSLEDLGVKFVRVQWVDFSNFVHCRVLTISHFYKLLRTSRPGITIAKVVLGLVFLTMAEGFGATGEYVLVVDLATVRVCGYAPGHAAVIGYFQEKYPLGGRLDVPLCPRTNLKRIVKYVAEELKTEFLVGFETEFILLTATRRRIRPANDHGWSRTAAFRCCPTCKMPGDNCPLSTCLSHHARKVFPLDTEGSERRIQYGDSAVMFIICTVYSNGSERPPQNSHVRFSAFSSYTLSR